MAAADADIARQEKEVELQERQVAIKERTLEAEIKKTAEAQKYAAEQQADARLYATQKASEADLYERQKQYGEAAKMDMQMAAIKLYFEQLPAIAEAAGQAYTNVDKIVMLGGDSTKLTSDIIGNVTQISEGLSQSLGIDLKTMLASLLGTKVAISTLPTEEQE